MAIANPFSKLSRPQLYAVLAGGAAIAAYAEYRHHQATGSWSPFASGSPASQDTSEAATGSPGTVTDPTTGQEYSDTAVDPSTQMTYASEITQYGSVAAAEAEVSQFGGSPPSTRQYDTGYTYAQQTDNLTTANGQNIYTSNSAWAQAVQAGLEAVSGSASYDGTDIGTALGKYLQGQPLDPGEVNVINVALSEYGRPPVGTYQIIPAPAQAAAPPPSGGTTTTPPPAKVTKPAMPGGVRATPYATFIDVGWNAVPGATGYSLHATYQEPASGGSGVYPGTVSGTSGRISGLAPNRTYTLHVAAVNSAGTSAETNGPAVKTKPK